MLINHIIKTMNRSATSSTTVNNGNKCNLPHLPPLSHPILTPLVRPSLPTHSILTAARVQMERSLRQSCMPVYD